MAIRGLVRSDYLLSAVILLTASSFYVDGRSNGAPESACSSMTPDHGVSAQSSASVYQITTSSTEYSPGQSITVSLSGTDGHDFMGFLLMAKDSVGNSVGTFSTASSDARTACSNTSVTHSNSNSKSTVTATWIAPASSQTGSVTFVATVVKSFRQFWMNVESAVITQSKSDGGITWRNTPKRATPTASVPFSSFPSLASTTSRIYTGLSLQTSTSSLAEAVANYTDEPTSSPDDVDTSGCDNSKACFRVPDHCTTNCDYILTWSNVGQAVSFELSASVSSSNYWVAFGLSLDQKMGDDDVVDCSVDDRTATITVQASRNEGRSNKILSEPTLGLVSGTLSGSFNNGRIICRFQRLRSVDKTSNKTGRYPRETASDTVFSLDDNSYYILLAKGDTSGGEKQQHSHRTFSASSVNFTSSSGASAADESQKRILIKTHGCMMLIAWMLFASFGVLMPRYCKSAWSDKTWCGKKIWFQIHQPFMALTLILTAVAFVLVFVAVRDYSQLSSPTFAHPPLGIAVMALVIINPIMSIFRPEPNAKRRPIFNMLHFLVGLIAHLAAVVTMFIGLFMPQLGLPLWCIGVMVVYICFHVLIEAVLAVEMNLTKCFPSKKHKITDEEVERPENDADAAEPRSSPSTSVSSSKFKTAVLGIHLCGVIGCCAAIVVQIALI